MDGAPAPFGRKSWALLSIVLLAFVAASTAVTWSWFDADEFVNLQQALRANAGHELYTETPSNHPPLYTWALQGALATGADPLLASRGLSVLLFTATLLLALDLLRQAAGRLTRLHVAVVASNTFLVVAASRAMNETLLLFLATLGLWLGLRHAAAGGIAWGLASAARISTLFFAPILLVRPRPLIAILGAAAGAAAAYALVPQEAWRAMLEQVVLFQAGRDAEPLLQRVAKWLAFSGVPLLAFIAWRRPEARDWSRPWPRAGLVIAGGSAFTLLLKVVHVHYFLAVLLLASCAAAWWLQQRLDEGLRAGDARSAQRDVVLRGSILLLVTVPLVLGYMAMTPNNDLGRSDALADTIRSHVAPHDAILTDAPQYAIRADRENLGGYYWSLHDDEDPWRSYAANASVVVVSERFGAYDRGFHPDVLASLADRVCLQAPGARLYVELERSGWPYPTCDVASGAAP